MRVVFFDLDVATGIDDWDDDERVREKQSYTSKKTYFLPDDGNGRAANLSVSDTTECPSDVYTGIDLFSGPCRITSVITDSNHFQTYGQPEIFIKDLNCKINLNLDTDLLKNYVVLSLPLNDFGVDIFNTLSLQRDYSATIESVNNSINFSKCLPGFYRVDVHNNYNIKFSITMIKCFPILVYYNASTRKYSIQKTIW